MPTLHKTLLLTLLLIHSSCNEDSNSEQTTKEVALSNPTAERASLPYLIKGNDGFLYLSWVVKGDSNLATLKYARLEHDSWTTPEVIASGKNWFVNWADYPMMAVDNNGNMIAHYLAKSSSGTYSYDVHVVIKPAGSKSWSEPIIPHKDGTPTEHGFATLLSNDDNTFTIAWLDGRNTGGGSHDSHGAGGAMTVRSAIIDLKGNLTEEIELDNRVCDCCQTTGVKTPSGTMVMYRDRSENEMRDMAFVQTANGKCTAPRRVAEDNWNIAGCPVNGPRAAATDDNMAIAWFTGANNQPKVKVAFGDSAGFSAPITIDATAPLGRVDIVMLDSENAVVSWMDGGETHSIKWRKVSRSGQMSEAVTLAEISPERGSGFPQMELIDNQLLFAWTEMGETTRVNLARVAL